MSDIRVFFASPFAPEYKWIREAIAAACRQYSVTLRAVDEITLPGANIVETIRQEIDEASLAVVVLSGLNPNVMYELGRLLQASKPVILLADEDTFQRLPFDIRSFATIRYKADKTSETDLIPVVSAALGRTIRMLSVENRKRFLVDRFEFPLPSMPPPVVLDIGDNIDFERRREEAERRMGKKQPCKTLEIEAQDEGGSVAAYTLIIRCPDGDDVVIIIDLNGEIRKTKVRV